VSLPLIDSVVAIDVNMVVIKFGKTIKISSLKNENFIVQTNSATPSVVSNPFADIQTLVDYNQISRTLRLYWDDQVVTMQLRPHSLQLELQTLQRF